MSFPKEPTPNEHKLQVVDAQDSSITKQLRQQKRRHVEVLVVCSCVLILLLILNTDSQRVSVNWWPDLPIPELCMSRSWFGINCPGCGLTRSFIALRNGDFVRAWHYHHLGWLMLLLVASQIPYRIYALRTQGDTPSQSRWPNWIAYFMIAALLINWLLNLLYDLK